MRRKKPAIGYYRIRCCEKKRIDNGTIPLKNHGCIISRRILDAQPRLSTSYIFHTQGCGGMYIFRRAVLAIRGDKREQTKEKNEDAKRCIYANLSNDGRIKYRG